MPVVEKVSLSILSDSELKSLEQKIVKLESLADRKQAATNEISRKKTRQTGIFASTEGQDALPSSIIKKRRKLTDNISRESDSILAALDKSRDKKSAAAIVKKSEFTKLQQKVNVQENILNNITRGQNLLSGASGLATPGGILSAASGAARIIPGLAIAIAAAQFVADKYIAQFGAGGTKDTRIKIRDEDLSNIGVENETDITSGRKLFLSNPLRNQGLPTGNSNTQNIRDGIRIFNLRQEGSYQ